MNPMRIAIGTDHRGFALKEFLIKQQHCAHIPIAWADVGAYTAERSDYPPFAAAVVSCIKQQQVDVGVLLCGNGVGMTIAANRFPGIYAGLAWTPTVAYSAKEDDNVNILVLPADYMSETRAIACITIWLTAQFKGGRYQDRLALIDHDTQP